MLADSIRQVPPDKRGAANATFWTAFDTGMAIGSISWGLLASVYGYYLVFQLAIIPVVLAMLVYLVKRNPVKNENNRIPEQVSK
jgi:predicted MFS family arabinose efflux permease